MDREPAFEELVGDIQVKLQTVFLKKADQNPGRQAMTIASIIPWSWVAVNIAQELAEYPTGLTDSVLLSILELKWEKTFIKRYRGFDTNFTSIKAVYDTNSAEYLLLEVVVKRWERIQETENYQITVSDEGKRDMDIIMQPKYNHWINYAPNQFFLDGRKIKIFCPPKINIVSERDEKYPRRNRVPLIPPTERLAIVLNQFDKEFVQREFPDKLRHINQQQQQRSKKYAFWLKIVHVENTVQTNAIGTIDGSKLTQVNIFLVDMSSDHLPIKLSLYDEMAQFAFILKRNDYIGLYDPLILHLARAPRVSGAESGAEIGEESSQETIKLEYSDNTVIFIMSEKEAQEARLAKINLTSAVIDDTDAISESDPTKKDIIERDEEGFMDCSKYAERICVRDLKYSMLHVTLFGKIVRLADNNPFIDKHGVKRDRYALRISDKTGTMDITFWEEAGLETRKLKKGQYILFDQLNTSDKNENEDKRWYVNGSSVCETKIYNISTLGSLLSSAPIRSISPLWLAKERQKDHFQIEGIITGWELHLKSIESDQFVLSDEYSSSEVLQQQQQQQMDEEEFMDHPLGERITTLAHTGCLRPHKDSRQTECKFCGCQIGNDVVYIFRPKPLTGAACGSGWQGWIEWRLDDGTSTCKAFGGEETLLNITAHHFKLLSHSSQINLLNSVIGLPILCSLTGTGTSVYRLDQVIMLESTQQECRDMVDLITSKK